MTLTDRPRTTIILYGSLLLIGLVAPFFVYPMFLMKVYVYGLWAVAFNLLFGFSGLLSFGHGAFFGTAAYATGHAIKAWGLSPDLGIIFGVLVGTGLAGVFGIFAIQRAGIYFAMITFALAEVVHFVALKMPLTGGENGLTQVKPGMFLGILDLSKPLVMYFVCFGIFILAFLVFVRIIHSPFGLALKAMKDSEDRAISLGYSPLRLKFQAFVLSGALAALAGSLKVVVFEFASLSDVHWLTNGQVILMTLLGGVGTYLGPVLGALVITGLENYLAFLGHWVTIITGLIFIVCVITFRRGICGEIPFLYEKYRRQLPGGRRSRSSSNSANATNQ